MGKHTLESLTSGMYNTPMVLFREYIQNAIDSIDDAIENGSLSASDARVIIRIDANNLRIVIEDNGVGVSVENIESCLLGIGNSNKSFFKRRGFRGIGRLVGIGYADELSFHTSYAGENVATTININCKKLRQILVPGQYENLGLIDALKAVIKRTERREKPELHYFRVELDHVVGNKDILNLEDVRAYLCQTAPLPYNTEIFSWGRDIEAACQAIGHPLTHYAIYLHHPDSIPTPLYKLYSDRFFVNMHKQQIDRLENIQINKITFDKNETKALVWYGHSNYLGTILDDRIKGLRFRKGNILVGDKSTANHLFKEERFNGWFQGEILVFDERIIPNSRRDDFEPNDDYDRLIDKLSSLGFELSRQVRYISSQRAERKSVFDKIQIISNQSPQAVTKYPQINLCSKLTLSEKKLLEEVFEVLDEKYPRKSSELHKIILAKVQSK